MIDPTPSPVAGIAGAWLALPGKLFPGLIAMVLIPLVFASIIQGLTGAPPGRQLKAVGLRFGLFVLGTTTLAAVGGVAITQSVASGDDVAGFAPLVPQEPPATGPIGTGRTAPDLIADVLPTKPARAFVKQDILAVGILSVPLLAFSTSSSDAVMPMSINTAITRRRVPPSTAKVVVPPGATVNMAGTALYQSAAVVFLAQLSGVDLTGTQIATIVFTLVVSSIGARGTPGVSIAILSSVVAGFGIPAAGIALILGVDRRLDRARTTVNVAGDLSACVLPRTLEPTTGLRGAPPGQPLPAEAA